MQTMEDEDYYLTYDFNGEADDNGCLIMDTDSAVGVGTADNGYDGGIKPSTNLIIHGHTMRSGMMFGGLKKYAESGNMEIYPPSSYRSKPDLCLFLSCLSSQY